MKYKVKKTFKSPVLGEKRTGDLVEVPDEIAGFWLRAGLIEIETKPEPESKKETKPLKVKKSRK